MKTTRTQFLTAVATGFAAVALKPSVLLGRMPDTPEPHQFRALVGKSFRVSTADSRGTIDIVLDAYNELPASTGTHQFSLTFVAPGGEKLTEGTYFVEQDQMGRFPIFVVPTRRDGQGRAFYRADFNLLVKK